MSGCSSSGRSLPTFHKGKVRCNVNSIKNHPTKTNLTTELKKQKNKQVLTCILKTIGCNTDRPLFQKNTDKKKEKDTQIHNKISFG